MLLKYLQICPDIFGYVGKWFDKKAMVNFKIYDVIGLTTNNYNPHIVQYSGTKVNKTMKFGQLIGYNMRNIFLKKSSIKFDGDGRPRLFYKKSILRISLECLKCYKSALTVCPRKVYQNILKLRC